MRFGGTVAFALLTGGLAFAGLGASAFNSWKQPQDDATPTPVAAEVDAFLSRTEAKREAPRARLQQVASGTVVDAAMFDPSPIRVSTAAAPAARPPEAAPQKAARAPKPQVVASAHAVSSPPSMPAELMPAEPDLPREALAMADTRAVDIPLPAASPAKPAPAPAAKKAEKPEKIDPNNLTPAQIARVKSTLNITPDQEQYWQPVEAALLDIAKQQAARRAKGSRYAMPATDSQQLYWTAGPLIMNLRPDQKQEARNLARSLGMTTVASLI